MVGVSLFESLPTTNGSSHLDLAASPLSSSLSPRADVGNIGYGSSQSLLEQDFHSKLCFSVASHPNLSLFSQSFTSSDALPQLLCLSFDRPRPTFTEDRTLLETYVLVPHAGKVHQGIMFFNDPIILNLRRCLPARAIDDPFHMERFNHDCSRELQVKIADLDKMRSQNLDFFLVLDLEGRVEILEFPVLLISAKTLEVEGIFHRFVRPSKMSDQRVTEYIEGKYGKFGVDRVWHDTAIPFKEVIRQFEVWLRQHQLWMGGKLIQGAFVTCGNWDLKTKVPQQCEVSRIKLPPYFMEWINLKDVYLNFYNRRATGMITMMRELQIPLLGSHHLGIDDTKNIARVVQRILADGAVMQITASRNPNSPADVTFLFKNRIG